MDTARESVLERGDAPPRMVVAPPGPESRALSQRLAAAEAPGINTLGADDAPAIVWRAALGANVLDVDGNRYVDLTAGFGAATLGHRHPSVVAAVARQAAQLVHGLGDVAAHPARVALAERLAALAPVDEARVHFAVSGADAIEVALKVAQLATRRPRILVFDPAYHGLTLGALAATSRPEFRAPFLPLLRQGVDRLRFGCPLATIERHFADSPGEVAAVLVEPVVGREGVRLPPAGWLSELAALARRQGALLAVDEILTGFGRTGALFAVDAEGVRPDLLCCGKALGGGLPIGAVVGRAALFAPLRTGGEALHTGTFVAHPLACAAALATLDALAGERLVERAREIGARIPAALAAPARAAGATLSGRGALWGLELPDPERARRLVAALAAAGVLVLGGGAHGCSVQISPPLSIAWPALDAALGAFAAALARLESNR